MREQVVHDAFVSRRSVSSDGAPGSDLYVSGAIYDAQRMILPEFLNVERYGRTREVTLNPSTIDSRRVAAADALSGKYLYLGTVHKHFGRFLLATMARAWRLVDLDPSIGIIAHTDKIEDTSELSGYVRTTLNALGIDPERLLLATRDPRVEELILPSSQFWIRGKGSPEFCLAFDHVREAIIRRGNLNYDLPKKIYLTRREHDKVMQQTLKKPKRELAARRLLRKSVVNETDAEALFAARGFRVVAPETLPFEQQIMMIGNASYVAGLAGSGLHMILFNNNPGTKLIQLSTRHLFTQQIINEIRGVDGHHIYCVQERDENQRPRLDTTAIERALDEIL